MPRPEPFMPIEEFAAAVAGRALFGLDLGTRTIGIAVSDPGWRIASPVTTLRRKKFRRDAEALLKLADTYAVGGFVLGLPINMDGSHGPRVQATRDFAGNLAGLSERPIAAWDERLSTAAADRMLIAADASRAKRAAVIDKVAAAYILQGALDRLRGLAAARAAPPAGDPLTPAPDR